MGTVALILGILGGVGGFFLYDLVVCTRRFGEVCVAAARPYETAGLVVMIFGGVLIVVGILLLAFAERWVPPVVQPRVGMEETPTGPMPPPAVKQKTNRLRGWTSGLGARVKEIGVKRVFIVAILGVLAIVALAVGIPLLQQALTQPQITLTDVNRTGFGCGFFSTSQQFDFTFTLTNTGEADGFATVSVLIDEAVWSGDTFFVPRGESVFKTLSQSVNDCNDHSADIQITSVSKA